MKINFFYCIQLNKAMYKLGGLFTGIYNVLINVDFLISPHLGTSQESEGREGKQM